MEGERELTEFEKAAKEIYWLLPRTLPEESWDKEYLTEVSAIIMRLTNKSVAGYQRIIRRCIAAATDTNVTPHEYSKNVFGPSLEEAGDYVSDRVAELKSEIQKQQTELSRHKK